NRVTNRRRPRAAASRRANWARRRCASATFCAAIRSATTFGRRIIVISGGFVCVKTYPRRSSLCVRPLLLGVATCFPLALSALATTRNWVEKRSSIRDSSITCRVRVVCGIKYSSTSPTIAINKALDHGTSLTVGPEHLGVQEPPPGVSEEPPQASSYPHHPNASSGSSSRGTGRSHCQPIYVREAGHVPRRVPQSRVIWRMTTQDGCRRP